MPPSSKQSHMTGVLDKNELDFLKKTYVNFVLQISSNYLRAMYSAKMKPTVVYIVKEVLTHKCRSII